VLEEKNLKIGKKHQAIINNISNKMIYVNLNEEGTIKGMIRCESKQEAKKFNK
jgi:predicted regulator of Ras-like GTPase activity (Roadblock/LC7/MglB family)